MIDSKLNWSVYLVNFLNISGLSGFEKEAKGYGPNKMKRLFKRKSSSRVFPEDLLTPTGGGVASPSDSISSGASSTSSVDGSNRGGGGQMFLFTGPTCPVPLRDAADDTEEGFLTPTQLYNCMNDGQFSPYILDVAYMLIVDTRSLSDYRQSHVVTALHVSDLDNDAIVQPLESYTVVILYDHKGLSHSLRDSIVGRTTRWLRSAGIDPFILVGGFDEFARCHPYYCTDAPACTEPERRLLFTNFPSIIVEDQLYLGRADQAASRCIIMALGVTHVVNVTREHPNAFPDELCYLRIDVDDETTENLLREFSSTTQFITDALAGGGRILAHCNLGMSRSSTIVVAYLMHSRRCTLLDAYQFLKERRPIIRPNRGFLNQLSRFEEILFSRKYTNVECLYN